MKRIRPVRQHDMSDCGAACLCAIARSFGYDLPLSKMREYASTDRSGTNVAGLVEAAEKMGFIAKGIKGAAEAIKSAPIPSIAHIILEGDLHHFVVLTRISGQSVKYMDPDGGTFKRVRYEEMQKMWTGVLVVLVPGTAFEKKKKNTSLFWRFMELVQPFRSTLIQSLIGAIMFSLLGLSTSLFVQKIIDIVLINRNINLLNLMGMAMICLLLMRMIISWFKSLFLLKVGHQVDGGLIMGYYRHLLSLPQRFFDRMRTGEILSRMNDAIKIRVFINHSLIDMIVAILTIVLTLLAMALLSWQLAIMVAAVLPLYSIIYIIFDRINKSVLRCLMEASAGLESQLVESVQAQRTIRSFGWQEWALNKTSATLAPVLKTSYKAGITSIFSGHTAEFIASLLTVLLLWNGSLKVLDGSLSPGELMSFYAMLGYLTGPLKNLGNLNQTLRDALIAADRLFQILDLEHEKNSGTGIRINRISQNIEFCNVNFRYGARPELFRDLSFTIPKGKMTGIVGKSGSGKSSIAALLRAEYLPNKGNLMINNCDIRQIERVSLRKMIGIVPQNIELFSGSILENISPIKVEADPDKLLRISEKTGLIQLINKLPAGFYTHVGEHGLDLSGGERQRIAIARALYQDPEILILDEATAALDPQSESEILGSVFETYKGSMTLIMITHKLSLVREADHLVLIDDGRVIESGTHKDLINSESRYRQLWSAQNQKSNI